MTAEIDPKIIKRTQDSLGKIIKKPTLTDKLLSRPPFRFLHDICTSVIRTTGIMKGLFTPEELIADNVKEKDAKLAFLQKLVDFLTIALGRQINVRIMSIIAGKEPDKTNDLLFSLAEAVNKGINNEEVVTRALQSGTVDHSSSKKKSSKGLESEARDQAHSGQESRKHKKVRKEDTKPDEKPERNDHIRSPEESKSRNKTPDKKTLPDKKDKDKIENGRRSRQSNGQPGYCGDFLPAEKPIEDINLPAQSHSNEQLTRIQRPSSAKGQRVPKEDTKSPIPQEEPKPEFVPNARLAPPRPRKTSEIPLEDSQKLIGISGRRVSGLIISDNRPDSDDDDDDDEDDAKFAIEETVGGGMLANNLLDNQATDLGENGENQQHGGLVTKMLQSKKEFEGGNLLNQKSDMQPSINNTGLNDATRERERAQIVKEISKLCESLQSLSKSALPLGKLMDFIQEDLDSMQQEYERWKSENQSLKTQLKREESLTHSSIEPLKAQLNELEHFAEEKRKAIMKFKAKILHNDERIQDLLSRSLEKVG